MLHEFKLNYFILFAYLSSLMIANRYTVHKNLSWFATLQQSSLNSPVGISSIIWSLSIAFLGCAAIIIWNKMPKSASFYPIIYGLWAAPLGNFIYTFALFELHNTKLAFSINLLVTIMIACTAILVARKSKEVSLLLLPYFINSTFFCYLNYQIYILNKGSALIS